MSEINEIQETQFQLMERASFNEFDGSLVVNDLRVNRDLWLAAIMWVSLDYDLIPLRDIPKGYWNVDTLYILCAKERAKELRKPASKWNADEVSWLRNVPSKLGDWTDEAKSWKILSLWWD